MENKQKSLVTEKFYENPPNYLVKSSSILPQSTQKTSDGPDSIYISAKTFIHENKGKFNQNYKIGHVIGKGSYGQVRKCLHIKSGQIRAVKLLSKTLLQGKAKDNLFKELEILRELVYSYIGSP